MAAAGDGATTGTSSSAMNHAVEDTAASSSAAAAAASNASVVKNLTMKDDDDDDATENSTELKSGGGGAVVVAINGTLVTLPPAFIAATGRDLTTATASASGTTLGRYDVGGQNVSVVGDVVTGASWSLVDNTTTITTTTISSSSSSSRVNIPGGNVTELEASGNDTTSADQLDERLPALLYGEVCYLRMIIAVFCY